MLEGREQGHDRIEEMAAHYIREIRNVQPEGPYQLGGWSMGGMVALEMARQLQTQNEQVPLLTLLDSHIEKSGFEFWCGTQRDKAGAVWRAWAERMGLASHIPQSPPNGFDCDNAALLIAFVQDLGLSPEQTSVWSDHLRRIEPDRQLEYLVKQAQEADIVPPSVELPALEHFFRVFKRNIQASRRYVPRSYSGRVLLFSAEDASNHGKSLNRWRKLVKNLEIHVVPANHYTIVREPHLAEITARLQTSL